MINQTQPVDDSNERWASKVGFLFAAVGFAVGLGNIWRFPYIVGENGGSAFVVIYLFCVFVIGAPILMTELMVGRRGQGHTKQHRVHCPGERCKLKLEMGRGTTFNNRFHNNDRLCRSGGLGSEVSGRGL